MNYLLFSSEVEQGGTAFIYKKIPLSFLLVRSMWIDTVLLLTVGIIYSKKYKHLNFVKLF